MPGAVLVGSLRCPIGHFFGRRICAMQGPCGVPAGSHRTLFGRSMYARRGPCGVPAGSKGKRPNNLKNGAREVNTSHLLISTLSRASPTRVARPIACASDPTTAKVSFVGRHLQGRIQIEC